jgi:radical SAM-linked protein
MIIRFKYCKKNEAKYLSHLDMLRILSRSIARAGIKAALSKGFNPKPRITLSNPIPLGVQSLAEYADVEVDANLDTGYFIKRINACLPENIIVLDAACTCNKLKSLMSTIDIVLYEFMIEGPEGKIKSFIDAYDSSSIYSFGTEAQQKKIFLLKIYGYAKIFNNNSNRIFKFNDFNKALSEFGQANGLHIKDSAKTAVFIIKGARLADPFEEVV